MALINRAKKEVNAKIVYFGPGLAGKKSIIEFIYKKLKPDLRGKLKSMPVRNDRMYFFDFSPAKMEEVKGYRMRFHLYTVPGEQPDAATWKMVLKGADGIVFVADSSPERLEDNVASLGLLRELLLGFGTPLEILPCIMQCNKSDVVDATTLDEMREALDVPELSIVASSVTDGTGVLQPLSALIRMVMKNVPESDLEASEEDLDRGQESLDVPSSAEEMESGSSEIAEPIQSDLDSVEVETEHPVGLDSSIAVSDKELPVESFGLDYLEGVAAAENSEAVMVQEPPEIEVAGTASVGPDGLIHLPVVITIGGKSTRISINLSVSLD